jgi:hypothetical protein
MGFGFRMWKKYKVEEMIETIITARDSMVDCYR